MLPIDQPETTTTDQTTTLDSHVIVTERVTVLPYSNDAFMQCAVKWIADTDQVSVSHCKLNIQHDVKTCQALNALEHPTFQDMIYMAARAPTGNIVKIPGRKAT